MSQSDYLKHKKISNKLNIDHSTNDPAVLDSQDYIHYRSYALKNEILNTKTKVLKHIIDNSKVY